MLLHHLKIHVITHAKFSENRISELRLKHDNSEIERDLPISRSLTVILPNHSERLGIT